MAVRDLTTECLIVGAGAAGCTLGYILRVAGRDVLALELFDAGSKDKLCGGMLGAGALELLANIYGSDAIDQLAPCRPPHIRSRVLDRELVDDNSYCTMPRKRFDDWLLARYVREGGRLLDRVRVDAIDANAHVALATDLRGGDALRISYGVLVGADGASSAVRRILSGRRQRIVVSVEGTVPSIGQDIIMSLEPGRAGYCWYIPTGEMAGVGCGMYGAKVGTCRAWLRDFCDEMGLVPGALRGAPLPTGDDVLLAPAEDAWLIGDAAGLISPQSGGGIHYALGSARLLASSLCGGKPYEQAIGPLVKPMEDTARHVKSKYLARMLLVRRRGVPIT